LSEPPKIVEGIVAAYHLDGKGGGLPLQQSDLQTLDTQQGLLWLHLDYTSEFTRQWLSESSGLDSVICDAILADETRPRCMSSQGGLLITLRGINHNPGADPEDMVSVRVWISQNLIITTRRRRLLIFDDIIESLKSGNGPTSAGEFLVTTTDLLAKKMADVIDNIDDAVDDLEEKVLTEESYQLRSQIADIRRQIISLRRYLSPQREAMTRLYSEQYELLSEKDRMKLREVADRTMRYVEDLDSARERASVTQEELGSRLAEQMNKRMYVLSIVAAIFLPLGFLTGLLGINVGGIPGAENKSAFFDFTIILATIVILQIIIFKWKKWM